jgi:hypothetical protein
MIASVADFENYTGKHVEDSASLQAYIDSAVDIIKNYIGYDPETSFNAEHIKGHNSNKLRLKHKPVNLVYKITDCETGQALFEAKRALTAHDYIASEEFVIFKHIVFPDHRLFAEYISGYGRSGLLFRAINGGNADTADWKAEYNCGTADSEHEDGVIAGGIAMDTGAPAMPAIFKQTTLRIAALLLTEANDNIGVTSKQFGDSGSRTFISYTNFDKYLSPLSRYKLIAI